MSENTQQIYLEMVIIMANGNFNVLQERNSSAEYGYDSGGSGWIYLKHKHDQLKFPGNVIAYRFYLATSYLSGGLRNWPRRRRGVASAHSHSPYFSAITHLKLSPEELTNEMKRFREKVLPHLLSEADKNRK